MHAFVGLNEDARGLVFEFDEPMLREQEGDRHWDIGLPSLEKVWSPQGSVAVKVYQMVASMDVNLVASDIAAAFAAAGHGVVLRQGLGPRNLVKAASTLRNEFIVLHRLGAGQLDQELIIEPHFRCHFELLAGNSSRYSALLSALPDVFVGPVAQLTQLVQLAAAYLSLEYRRLDRDVPPWRSAAALMSLWLPEYAKDVPGGSLSAASSVYGASPVESLDVSPIGSLDSLVSLSLERPMAGVAVKTVYGFSRPSLGKYPVAAALSIGEGRVSSLRGLF